MESQVDTDSKIPRGRSLTFVSLGFIIFILGEGSIGDSVTFALIGLTLGNPGVLYWLAWIALFWSAWRFWIVNPKPFIHLAGDIKNSMLNEQGEAFEGHYSQASKITFQGLTIDAEFYDVNKHTRECSDSVPITIPIFKKVGWKVKHTLKAIGQADGFAESLIPYLVFFIALVLAGWEVLA